VTIAGTTVTVSQGAATLDLSGTWTASDGRSSYPIQITQPAGGSSFSLSSSSTLDGGIIVSATGTGTVSGTAVRISLRWSVSTPAGPCSGADEWTLTLNAAGTAMTGSGRESPACFGETFLSVGSLTLTRR
jgi:hypothetical protein